MPKLFGSVRDTAHRWVDGVSMARVEDYRRIISTFKSTTAVAFDNLAPRALNMLSDATIREIIALYNRCEHEERWPDKWSHDYVA